MKKTHVFLFVDALGWEIVSRHRFLERELPYRYPAKMQFGYSSTALPTILSGRPPREHGHFSFFYYDPKRSPFKIFKWLAPLMRPRSLFDRGRVRRHLSKWFARWKGFSGYFQLYSVPFEKLPLFDYCEKTDIFAPGGLAPVKGLRDLLEESGLQWHMSHWRRSTDDNIAAACDVLERGAADFAFVYAGEFDGFMHDHAGDEKAVSAAVDVYAEKTRRLLRALEKSGRPYALTVISDHGMTPTKGTVDLSAKLRELPFVYGKDYVSVADSTLLRLWYLNDRARAGIRARLSAPDCRGHLLSQDEKRGYGIDFPHDKFGEDIFLTEVGVQISPCDLGSTVLRGMHGYAPEDANSTAACLSTEPAFAVPRTVADFFALMAHAIEESRHE